MAKQYGKVYGTVGFSNRSLVINDPDLIHEVLVTRFNEFPERFPYNFGTSQKVTKILSLINDKADWKRIRAVFASALSLLKQKAMMSHIIEITDTFIEGFEQNLKPGKIDLIICPWINKWNQNVLDLLLIFVFSFRTIFKL